MARSVETYNGNLVWKVRKSNSERTPSVDQRRRLPIERLDGEDDEFQYVTYYNCVNRDNFPAHIGTFIAIWEYLSGELQKLHDCQIVHGFIGCDTIIFTELNSVVFSGFYGMPHVPFSEAAAHRDKVNLLEAVRQMFSAEEPHRYPLKRLIDLFEQTKCNSTWLRTIATSNRQLVNCTFTAKIDDTSYECTFSSSRVYCVLKFTNDEEEYAYKMLSSNHVCPTLMFSCMRDPCFGSYICYAKIASKCPLQVDINSVILSFRLLDTMHSNKILHLNIGPDTVVCQSLKDTNNRKRVMFVDFSASRNLSGLASCKLSNTVHSVELTREPSCWDYAKSDDVFSLAVLMLCKLTRISPGQISSIVADKKTARRAYADIRELFKREFDTRIEPMCKILLEAIAPHEERPRASVVVTKLRSIKQVN